MNGNHGHGNGTPQDSSTLKGLGVLNELHQAYPNSKKVKWPWVIILFCVLLFCFFLVFIPAYSKWKYAKEEQVASSRQARTWVMPQNVEFLV